MTSLLVRRALPEDLGKILALQAEDSMHYYDEPEQISANQLAAFDEIDADVNHDLLVGELDGQIACTAQVTWLRVLSADGGLYCQVEAVRTSSSMRGQATLAGALGLAFNEEIFAPRINLSQSDITSLDGSNRVGRDPLRDLMNNTGDTAP